MARLHSSRAAMQSSRNRGLPNFFATSNQDLLGNQGKFLILAGQISRCLARSSSNGRRKNDVSFRGIVPFGSSSTVSSCLADQTPISFPSAPAPTNRHHNARQWPRTARGQGSHNHTTGPTVTHSRLQHREVTRQECGLKTTPPPPPGSETWR